ncbi:MAG TPA: enoyl-CoA hydratase-related protein [Pyrinomonadaceae bacterium]|jgi:enoyl-CoA hydratase|nr:enoyl-CoA hydratase-related protein [Pyrinomonadaceae bacterium]
MPEDTTDIVVEERGDAAAAVGLVYVRLNRPAKRNALTRAMLERLTEIFRAFSERTNLRAVVLTGTGHAAFSAGTDIAELDGLTRAGALETARRGQETCEAIELCPVPVIAAVNGIAAGGGCELALACHLRLAATHATFSLPELKLGMIPAYGGTQRLARAVGHGRALAAMLAGESLPAEEALRFGLVNRVVAAEQLSNEAETLAASLSQFAPLAVRACLAAVTRGARLPLTDGLALEAELFANLFSTEDVREGTRAFLEKRAPIFKGK